MLHNKKMLQIERRKFYSSFVAVLNCEAKYTYLARLLIFRFDFTDIKFSNFIKVGQWQK